MPIEFDPNTSTYYQTTYSANTYVQKPVENQSVPPVKEVSFVPNAFEIIPQDPALMETENRQPTPNPNTPHIGSIIDTVV